MQFLGKVWKLEDDEDDGFEPSQEAGEHEVRDDDPVNVREEEDQDDDDGDVRRSGDEQDGDVDEVGPREDDRDDDDLDIEGMDGEVRLAKRGTLSMKPKLFNTF